MLQGIILLAITGSSWVVIGAVSGYAGKKGLNLGVIQMLAAVCQVVIGMAVISFQPPPACSGSVVLLTTGSVFVSGFCNYFVIDFMGKAMKNGPNGIVWAVVQSALIFPFLTGVVGFGVALTGSRIAGMAAIIAALALFGLSRDNRFGAGGGWRSAMIASFLLAGGAQNFACLPSYFPEAAAVGSVHRSLAAALGTGAAFLLAERSRLWRAETRSCLADRRYWVFAAELVAVGVAGGYFLMYRGFDLLAASGVGAISYPVLVCSCLVGFTCYSRLALREKLVRMQYAGLGCAIAGIVLISLP